MNANVTKYVAYIQKQQRKSKITPKLTVRHEGKIEAREEGRMERTRERKKRRGEKKKGSGRK